MTLDEITIGEEGGRRRQGFGQEEAVAGKAWPLSPWVHRLPTVLEDKWRKWTKEEGGDQMCKTLGMGQAKRQQMPMAFASVEVIGDLNEQFRESTGGK
jgi:hypothetical protein